MKTQVAIIGAGPAGLLLGHLLFQKGIDTIILENRNESFIRNNWRGGLIETTVVDVLTKNGVGEQLLKNGIPVTGIYIHVKGEKHFIPFEGLKDNDPIIYNQHNIVGDLIDERKTNKLPIIFEGKAQRYENLDSSEITIHYTLDASLHSLECEFIAACDGYRGISRQVLPKQDRNEFLEELPYAWLDWLVDTEPNTKTPIYAYHESGFAMQIPTSDGKTRFHAQVARGVEFDDLPSQEQLWETLEQRLGQSVNRGEILQKKLDYMRSFHSHAWQYKNLYLAGDAAHMIDRTLLKGLNMAFADAIYLADAFEEFYSEKKDHQLKKYTTRALQRTLKIKKYSAWFSKLIHPLSMQTSEEKIKQLNALKEVVNNKSMIQEFTKNFTGLPI